VNRRNLFVEMRKLTASEKRSIERRERKHRSRLARLGFTTRALVDESGLFGVVMVEDPASGRTGLLLPDGEIRWIGEAMSPGALADATLSGIKIAGRPT
jgi:hypothetical protein